MPFSDTPTPAEAKVLDLAEGLATKVSDAADKVTGEQATLAAKVSIDRANDQNQRDLILAEVKGLASTIEARFDGVERDQNSVKEWMGRLATTLEKQVEVTAKFIGFEVRMSGFEANQSDFKLDLASVKDAQTSNEQEGVKNRLFRTGLLALAAAIGGAIVSAVATKIVG